MTGGRPRVVFIGGASRSGSTLLDRILGEIPGFLSTGELRRIWDRGIQADHLCGCGSRFLQCDFWKSVITTAYGSVDALDAGAIRRRRARVERPRNVPRLLLSRLRTKRFDTVLGDYLEAVSPLYDALARVSGCDVIVDSSKAPMHGMSLLSNENLDVRVIHLVRDSRAVAFSQQRRRVKLDVADGEAFMRTLDPRVAAKKWLSSNGQTGFIRFTHPGRYLRVRYEDLARDPAAVMKRIGSFIGAPPTSFDSLQDGSVRLGVSHTVSGNTMRFDNGGVHIKLDSEWERAMRRKDRLVVTALTAPMLLTYGYPLQRSQNGG